MPDVSREALLWIRCVCVCVCVCVCFTGGDGVNSCLHSYRGTKAGLFFPVDRVEIQAGTAERRRGRAKAGGGRRCPVSGGESRAAGRLSPSPRLGVLRLLGQNLGMGAMCLRRNGSGWQLVFQRHQMRGPYLHQPRRKPLQVLLMSRGNWSEKWSNLPSSFVGVNIPFCVSRDISHLGCLLRINNI